MVDSAAAGPVDGLQQRPAPRECRERTRCSCAGGGLGDHCCGIVHGDAEDVEFKEMGMGALAATCGVGMALKAMVDFEKNPILIDGRVRSRASSLCNLPVAAFATHPRNACVAVHVGANEFVTLDDAYAAVAQATASVGVMLFCMYVPYPTPQKSGGGFSFAKRSKSIQSFICGTSIT